MTSTVFFSMGLIRTAAILAIDNRLGVTILKQAPFWGVNFSLVRNMRGVKFYDTATAV